MVRCVCVCEGLVHALPPFTSAWMKRQKEKASSVVLWWYHVPTRMSRELCVCPDEPCGKCEAIAQLWNDGNQCPPTHGLDPSSSPILAPYWGSSAGDLMWNETRT